MSIYVVLFTKDSYYEFWLGRRVIFSVPYSLLPPLLSSLVDVEYESVFLHRETGLLVFDLARLAEALVLVLLLWSPSLCLLEVDREALARHSEEIEVLIFNLADVVKVLAQFEHSSEVLVFILDASLEAIEQFEQATEVKEAFLGHCLRLCLDCFVFYLWLC